MAGYTNMDQNEYQSYYSYYNQFQNQSLEFNQNYDESFSTMPNQTFSQLPPPTEEEEEPPLLEELEIYPDRIWEKVLAVLNPFRGHGLVDDADYLTRESDLAGPIFFYLLVAFSLFISGKQAHFGYIYGITVISCLFMYALLNLMTTKNEAFTLTCVASILGYSLIPVLGLSILGIFIQLKNLMGIILAILAVLWSSYSASRLFVAISGDKEQQPLIAYPGALVSGIYVLLVLF